MKFDGLAAILAVMVDVAITPASARAAEVTVVIDVVRATSTIVQALAGGYKRVLAADSIDRARTLAAPGRLIAGEERCVAPPDFDLGNSPGDVAQARAEELVLATTNGAPAIVLASTLSETVLIAALLNLDAIVEALAQTEDVQILCAATGGRVSIEDTYVAGRIAQRLEGEHSDAALVACALARAYPDSRSALSAGQAYRLLAEADLTSDLEWCARESTVQAIPRVTAVNDGIAVLSLGNKEDSISAEEHIAVNL